jgi:hypothetical protein
MRKNRWQRFKDWWTIDHVVDVLVDVFLIVFNVINSPVLIVMRLIRHYIGEWFVNLIKGMIKGVAHWFARKREYRLKHGHGIFRTYWYLIIFSPFIVLGIWLLGALLYGMYLGYHGK